MARRPTAGPGKPTRRLSGQFTPSSAWPHIEEFVESGGNIHIGPIAPIKCAAVAADPHGMIAALVRHVSGGFKTVEIGRIENRGVKAGLRRT